MELKPKTAEAMNKVVQALKDTEFELHEDRDPALL